MYKKDIDMKKETSYFGGLYNNGGGRNNYSAVCINSCVQLENHSQLKLLLRSLLVVAAFLCLYAGAWAQTSYNFDASSTAGWTFVDSDGDGYDWRLASSLLGTGFGRNGSADAILSQSYANGFGVLYPDNWAITPRITLPASGIIDLKYFAAVQDANDDEEHYGVYISTNVNPRDLTAYHCLGEETMSYGGGAGLRATGTWGEKHVDLSAYAGQQVYIAFRHFNCSNMFYLLIDDIEITSRQLSVAVSPAEYVCGDEITLTASVTGGVPSGFTYHWYSNAACTAEITTGLSGANNSVLSVTSVNGAQYYCRLEGVENRVTNFDYSGEVRQYTVPEGATSLKLEVWGAQGGNADIRYTGGLGGYSVGTLSSPSGTLYVCVGGVGTTDDGSYSSRTLLSGGYNGGGAGRAWKNTTHGGAGGGGATHIATMTGTLSSIGYSNRSSVLIVAGGGGGASDNGNGGDGGGTSGIAGSGTGGCNPGTQTTGSAWGYATDCSYANGECGGGGGGWYGGYSATAENYAGGGGSGYIGGVTGGTTTAGQREGDGYARITAFVPKVFSSAPITIECGCRENPNTFQFDFSSQTMNIGDVATTYTATNNTGLAVTYSSEIPAIATVDPSTGEVHALSDGTVKIFAYIPEDAVHNYCEKTIFYTLTVNCTGGTPTIDFPAEYSAGTITYTQGSGIKYPDIRVNGAVLPSSAYGDVTNTGGADIAVATGGVVRINTARAGSAHISLYVPATGGYCSTTVDFDVEVVCSPVTLSVSYAGCTSHSYDAGTNTYTLVYEQNAGADPLTSIVSYNGSNQLPSVSTCETSNPYVANLINGDDANKVFRVDLSASTANPVSATLRVPAHGSDCACDEIHFVIDIVCTDPVITYEHIYDYTFESGAAAEAVPIVYPGLSGNRLPEGTRFVSTNTLISYFDDGKVMVNVGATGAANVRLRIPAYGRYCAAIIEFSVSVKYPCTSENEIFLTEGLDGSMYVEEYAPIYHNQFSYTQQLFTSSELGLTGQNLITKIWFYYSTSSSDPVEAPLSMYMGNTTESDLSGGWITEITKVVANKTVEFYNGWNEIELERPFLYDATKNLVVAVYADPVYYTDYFISVIVGGQYCRYANSGSSFTMINKVPSGNNGNINEYSGSYYRPIMVLCATKQYTLTYAGGSTCAACATPGTVEPTSLPAQQTGYGLVRLSNVEPICTAPHSTFVGWSKLENGADGADNYYMAGDNFNLTQNETLYAVFIDTCGTIVPPTPLGTAGTDVVTGGTIPYYTVCYGQSLQLDAEVEGLDDAEIREWRWSINTHNGEDPVVLHGKTPTYTPEEINGNDFDLFVVRRSDGCVAKSSGRIKIGGGMTPNPNNYTAGEICLGRHLDLVVGSADGADVHVDPLPINITAKLGQADTTFIPDGPNCLDECYTSSVTFYDFPTGSTITSANNINYVRVNMEHSFIGDLQIKITCPPPASKSAILLEDWDRSSGGGYDDFGSGTSDYTWHYRADNGNRRALGMGIPSGNNHDGSDYCSVDDNPYGVGLDYCWSNRTSIGGRTITYAGGEHGYVHEQGSALGGGEFQNHYLGEEYESAYMLVRPSDVENLTQFYHPRQNLFAQLEGCPLNGTWTLSVCDNFGIDNGYIFNWEISLSEDLFPDSWNYTVDVGGSRVENMQEGVENFNNPTLNIRPTHPDQEGAHTSYLVITDNLGCDLAPVPISYSVNEAFHVNILQPGMVCVGSEATLSANPALPTYSYEWKPTLDGAVLNTSATYRPEIYGNSSYVLVVEDSNVDGCKSFSYADVNIKYPPLGSLDGDFVWSGVSTDWNHDNNWFKLTDAAEGIYTLQSGAGREYPSTSSNVFVASYYDCVSDPTLNVNVDAGVKDLTIGDGITINGGSNALSVAGDMTFNGTADFAPGSGTVSFVGSGDQTITKSDEIDFKNVVFNQGAAGHTITADNGITVSGAATFTNGVVVGDATFEENSRVTNTIAEMTRASYVDGLVTKKGSETFTFPTGGDGVLGAFSVTLGSNTGDVNVKFNHSTADNGDGTHGFTLAEFPRWWNINDMCSGNSPQLDHVSNFEYWKVEGLGENTALSGLTLKVDADAATEHFHNSSAYDRSKIYAAAHYDCWKNLGEATVTVSDDHKTITVAGVSSIPRTRAGNFDGIVTLGSTDHNTILPIELTSLTATCDGRSSLVEWTTASERNNDYFIVERSDNAIEFYEVARVAGAGNSIAPLDYSYTDYGVHGGDNYYRLVQVDYDGTRTVSEMVVATCVEAGEAPEVLAYPNPFSGDLTVELENFGNQPARIDVYDVLGRLVYTEDVDAPQNNYQTVLHLGALPEATYTVRVGTADFVINRKVVKQ